jgi:hypothetical protein
MCKHDHRDTHDGYWDVSITDGVVKVARPGWADPKPARLHHPPAPAPAAAAAAEPPPGTPPEPASTTRGPGAPGTADPFWPDDPLPPTTTGARPSSPARAWPHTGDTAWITPDETARLNPWGDDPDQTTPSAQTPSSGQTPPRTPTDPATWTSPWGDEDEKSAPGP